MYINKIIKKKYKGLNTILGKFVCFHLLIQNPSVVNVYLEIVLFHFILLNYQNKNVIKTILINIRVWCKYLWQKAGLTDLLFFNINHFRISKVFYKIFDSLLFFTALAEMHGVFILKINKTNTSFYNLFVLPQLLKRLSKSTRIIIYYDVVFVMAVLE